MKLYTTIPTAKLADFLDMKETDSRLLCLIFIWALSMLMPLHIISTREDLIDFICSTEMLNWKAKNNELQWQSGPVSSGVRQSAGDLQYWISNVSSFCFQGFHHLCDMCDFGVCGSYIYVVVNH